MEHNHAWAESLRQEFTLNKGVVYLNSGSLSKCPTVVINTVLDEIRRAELNPTEHLFGAWERFWAAQKAFAGMIRARPEDLFLRPNVTMAMNEFIMNTPLAGDGEILVSNLEYGAIVNLCRFRAEKSGLKLRELPLPLDATSAQTLTPAKLLDIVVSELKPHTRLLMLSHIITGTGLVFPIEDIARECRNRDILFAVDGAHGPGAVELNFEKLTDVDFYGGNIHKWLMGPKGTGFGWVHPRWQEDLQPLHAGWTTYGAKYNFSAFAPNSLFAQRFLYSSSLEFAPFFALPRLAEWWNHWEPRKIRERLYGLQDHLLRRLQENEWTILSPSDRRLRGPLVTVELPESLAKMGYELMFKLAQESNVWITTPIVAGRTRLRLSPHVYNTEDEIDFAVKTIKTKMAGSH